MRLSVFCGVSVDGFLARTDDTFDFLTAGEQEPHGFTEFMASVDVVVIGRRTFDVVRKLGHIGLYGKKALVVLSSRPLDYSAPKGTALEWESGEPAEVVKRLEGRGFRHAYVDGGITIQRFLAAGCITRMVMTRVPVLIGAGISLFGPLPHDVALRHIRTSTFPGGLVQSEYEVAGTGASAGDGANTQR